MELNINDIKAIIRFAKEQNIPNLKIGNMEVTMPPRDATESELETIKQDIETLKAICSKMVVALEMNSKQSHTPTPFRRRVEAKHHA